ncbi:MAG: aminoglycoside phosphotransferase family protein [Chloroflexota bacterium]|nr:aminoglycoside phosphotransferase family protein [Chloroflexota bacterium]
MGLNNYQAKFRVFRMGGSNEVYMYEEKHSNVQVVGKFFTGKGQSGSYVPEKCQRMEQEFHNLHMMRDYGLVGYPHDVVRPLGYNGWLNSLLVEEYRGGQSLSSIITDAILSQQPDKLYGKLTALAYFMATFHNRTANGYGVNFHEDCAYFDRLVHKLAKKQFINWDEVQEFSWLRERWREQPRMWEDQQVLVHGDATPSNFLFGQGLSVIGIDLERMKRADRVFDIGRITGELQHFFLQITGNKYAAEPFIGHFLWEYACHFPNRDSAFRSISKRMPFQMGLTLLRIARNSWISHNYRLRLIEEAKIILRTF